MTTVNDWEIWLGKMTAKSDWAKSLSKLLGKWLGRIIGKSVSEKKKGNDYDLLGNDLGEWLGRVTGKIIGKNGREKWLRKVTDKNYWEIS